MTFRVMQSLFNCVPKSSRVTPFAGFLLKSSPALTKPSAQSFVQFSPSKSKHPVSGLASLFARNCQVQQPSFIGTANNLSPFFYQPQRNFHLLTQLTVKKSIFSSTLISDISQQTRTVTKFSLRKGRRKTVKAVVCRFYRLDWGIWIHPRSGRHRKLWKKGKLRRKRLRMHVFTNAWQTRTLERMTTKYWHKKKYWVDDPYEPYHKRDNFPITKNTRNIYDQLI